MLKGHRFELVVTGQKDKKKVEEMVLTPSGVYARVGSTAVDQHALEAWREATGHTDEVRAAKLVEQRTALHNKLKEAMQLLTTAQQNVSLLEMQVQAADVLHEASLPPSK